MNASKNASRTFRSLQSAVTQLGEAIAAGSDEDITFWKDSVVFWAGSLADWHDIEKKKKKKKKRLGAASIVKNQA